MPEEKKKIRTRFAPSPTGTLNLGGARTALFSWIFARANEGDFVLRMEDTDKERSKKEYEENIIETMKWLGLNWDEFCRQSDRQERYEHYLSELLNKNLAYYCFCSQEENQKEQEAKLIQGLPPKYGGKCRSIPHEEALIRAGKEKAVIRLKIPEKEISFTDLVRGKLTFDLGLIGDPIIAKSLKEPLFNFANVVDDFEMNISHVVRGEDHISNTPCQIAIQEALGFPSMKYAHLPLILGSNKKKLSKRDMAKSILDYRAEGYVSGAIINFLGLMGWHPKEDREVFSIEEMVKEFSFERVQKAGGIFNPEKLDWLNGYYIKAMSPEMLADELPPFIPEEWIENRELLVKVIGVEKERMKKLSDFTDAVGFIFKLPEYDPQSLLWKTMDRKEAENNLNECLRVLGEIAEKDFEANIIESKMMLVAEMRGRGELLWPLRVALSGQKNSPGPFELASILGKDETLRRIYYAIQILAS